MASNASACSICNERDHFTEKCPELRPDNGTGFYKPQGGYSEGGDDDDEHVHFLNYRSILETYMGMPLVWCKTFEIGEVLSK